MKSPSSKAPKAREEWAAGEAGDLFEELVSPKPRDSATPYNRVMCHLMSRAGHCNWMATGTLWRLQRPSLGRDTSERGTHMNWTPRRGGVANNLVENDACVTSQRVVVVDDEQSILTSIAQVLAGGLPHHAVSTSV